MAEGAGSESIDLTRAWKTMEGQAEYERELNSRAGRTAYRDALRDVAMMAGGSILNHTQDGDLIHDYRVRIQPTDLIPDDRPAEDDTSEIDRLAYLITAKRFQERGLRHPINPEDVAVCRPLAEFLHAEGYRDHTPDHTPPPAAEEHSSSRLIDRLADRIADAYNQAEDPHDLAHSLVQMIHEPKDSTS